MHKSIYGRCNSYFRPYYQLLNIFKSNLLIMILYITVIFITHFTYCSLLQSNWHSDSDCQAAAVYSRIYEEQLGELGLIRESVSYTGVSGFDIIIIRLFLQGGPTVAA